jgi:DNA polymerase III subunit gamma/tau
MAYTALARTWRPKKFAELVGQEHVRRALTNALETGRVHHAFLFTGTRGVGKTTIARIFAKCLNCEAGVTANPCGTCGACREIDSGRFVDLVEVDAASNTKVDDTRELLDNVQYAPARGRYKVYLIDEVHMLSTHSFNALLKTLEEPPPHVKFLLATTDPQKLPITVLSRCLQFNLKRLPVTLIADRMKEILEKEGIPFEPAGLRLVAQAADGSMRDGLSLLDQLIAFGNGKAGEEEARAMLGTIARDHVVRLAELLGAMNVPELLSCARSLEEFAPDYAQVLDELSSLFVRIAMKQALSDFEGDELYDPEVLTRLAKAIAPEDVQLFYQTAITGRRDLGLAPDPRSGFEMTLLRMIAFRPLGEAEQSRGGPSTGGGGGISASSSSGGGAAAARAAAAGRGSPGGPRAVGAEVAVGSAGGTFATSDAADRGAAVAGGSATTSSSTLLSGAAAARAAAAGLTGKTLGAQSNAANVNAGAAGAGGGRPVGSSGVPPNGSAAFAGGVATGTVASMRSGASAIAGAANVGDHASADDLTERPASRAPANVPTPEHTANRPSAATAPESSANLRSAGTPTKRNADPPSAGAPAERSANLQSAGTPSDRNADRPSAGAPLERSANLRSAGTPPERTAGRPSAGAAAEPAGGWARSDAGATATELGEPWSVLIGRLELGGAARQLASNCHMVSRQGGAIRLALDARNKHMRTPAQEEKLSQALSRHFGQPIRLEFEMASADIETPAQAEQRAGLEDLEAARRAFESDPGVQGLKERFGATLLPETIRPVK